jgi:hypothetical protein
MVALFLFLKGITDALATFSYLVNHKQLVGLEHLHNLKANVLYSLKNAITVNKAA